MDQNRMPLVEALQQFREEAPAISVFRDTGLSAGWMRR